jgi:lysophospholipase L1-like esterase
MRLTAVKHVEDHPMSINAKTNRVPATFILVTMIAVTLPVGFAYGIGVGRYEWPPAAYLRSARQLILGYPETNPQVIDYIEAQSSIFQSTPGDAEVVMLGDSLTERGNWQEILPEFKVINRGISSDETSGVLARLPEVISRHPRLVFLMIGANDLQRGVAPEIVAGKIEQIVLSLQEAHVRPVLASVLFVSDRFVADGYRDINPSTERLNNLLRDLARNTNVAFLELNAVLAPLGRLASEFTYDGQHLKGAAYIHWRNAIRSLIGSEATMQRR